MSALRVRLLADPGDLELAGAQGRFDWGEIRVEPHEGALPIQLVRPGAPAANDAVAWDAATATVFRDGRHAWRRLPWPAGTRAFEVTGPSRGRALVAGPPELRDPIAERLHARGIETDRQDSIILSSIEAASVVCLPTRPNAPPPPEAMAVLAAGRVLVTGRCDPAFALQPGIDCFMESTADGAAQRAEAVVRWPEGFRATRAMGRVTAARHRADVLLHRLAVDAALGVP